MKKRNLYIIALCIMLLGVIIPGVYQFRTAVINDPKIQSGVIALGEQSPETDIYLNGKWEFYPGVHLISEQYDGTPLLYSVPSNLNYDFRTKQEAGQKVSYKITVSGAEMFDREGLMLILPDLYADCKVFIDGIERTLRVPNPWGWPVYSLAVYNHDDQTMQLSDPTEIVLELSGVNSGLNMTPRLCSLKNAMTFFDSVKIFSIAFLFVSVIAFLLYLILGVVNKKKVGLQAGIGLIFTAIYLIHAAFYSGFLDVIMKTISLNSIDGLILLLLHCVLALIVLNHKKYYPDKLRIVIYILLAVSWMARIICMWLGIWGFFSWIPAVLFIVIAFLLIRGIIKDMNSEGTDYLFSAIAFTALLMAAVVCFLNFIIKLSILLTYVLPIFVVLYLVFLLAVFLSHERVRANKLEEKLALEKDMSKMQTALFAAKMRPHFLYNSLSSIQELCYQDPEKAASLIVKFSNYLRTNIDFMDFTELIPFETELDNIYNYVYIQKERFGDSLRFYDKIDCTDFKVPPFIVQPLIENAINYGVRQSLEGGCVWLDVFDEKDHIIIEVRNEGEELREDQLRTNHSVDNIRKRLEILLEGSLTIAYDKEKRIVTVRIQIPKR